jgi:hypothetical protein
VRTQALEPDKGALIQGGGLQERQDSQAVAAAGKLVKVCGQALETDKGALIEGGRLQERQDMQQRQQQASWSKVCGQALETDEGGLIEGGQAGQPGSGSSRQVGQGGRASVLGLPDGRP